MDIKKIDTEAINKVANGEYTSGTTIFRASRFMSVWMKSMT